MVCRPRPGRGAFALAVSDPADQVEDQNTVVIAAAAIATIVVITMLLLWLRRRRRGRRRDSQDPLPLIPVASGRGGPPAPPHRATAPFGHASVGRSTAPSQWRADLDANGRPDSHDRFAPPTEVHPMPATVAVGGHSESATGSAIIDAHGEARSALAETARPADGAVAGAAVDGASVRYWRPADGTLQFLPGRLEVIAGRDAGQEIRFVRTPGPDGARVTFGRAEGAPYRHIQLREPTVSRAHARMTLESRGATSPDGRGLIAHWQLENLSATNPVVVNGRALAADGGDDSGVELRDGDRIEMGEVVFRFHSK